MYRWRVIAISPPPPQGLVGANEMTEYEASSVRGPSFLRSHPAYASSSLFWNLLWGSGLAVSFLPLSPHVEQGPALSHPVPSVTHPSLPWVHFSLCTERTTRLGQTRENNFHSCSAERFQVRNHCWLGSLEVNQIIRTSRGPVVQNPPASQGTWGN